jgi:hypothetical protein
MRGDRFYAVEDAVTVDATSFTVKGRNGTVEAHINVLVGTMIFFNHRRATAAFMLEEAQLLADLEKLAEYLRVELYGWDLKVTHETLGEYGIKL